MYLLGPFFTISFTCSQPANEGGGDFSEQLLESFSQHLPAVASPLLESSSPQPLIQLHQSEAAEQQLCLGTKPSQRDSGGRNGPWGSAGGKAEEAAEAIKALSCELNAGPAWMTLVLASSDCEAEDRHSDCRQAARYILLQLQSRCFSSSS